jgi:L-seryl-tRNA(Ser) seleniumtransferase
MAVNPLRSIPSIHELLENPTLKALAGRLHPGAVVSTVRVVLDEVAAEVHTAATDRALPSMTELAERIARRVLEGDSPQSRMAINATGVLLHPELGCPPWASASIEAMAAAAGGYTARSAAWPGRAADDLDPLRQRLKDLTGAEAACVLASPAAAAIAALAALAARQDVLIARSDVIQRGRDYRLAELAEAASVAIHEVGAANYVDLDDYRGAIGQPVGAILVVHRGRRADCAGEQPSLKDLVHLGRENRRPVIHDLGPACLGNLASLWIDFAPRASTSVEAGADIVLVSHELLGGPRCGIVVGRRSLVERIARHPLAVAAAADRPTLAALRATLDLLASADDARRYVPLVGLLAASAENLKNRAERMAPQMAAGKPVAAAEIVPAAGLLTPWMPGPGEMPGWGIAIRPRDMSVGQLAEMLRRGDPAVMGQDDGNRLLVNLRSIPAEQDVRLVEAITASPAPGRG